MSPSVELLNSQPSPEEIRAQLQKMCVSDVFSVSPQLVVFLRFVVEAALHGRGHRLKGYIIGVEVLRRATDFDPQTDPIVRVEATRLRRTIQRYYAGPGTTDEIFIEVPKGGYVPTFSRRSFRSGDVASASSPIRLISQFTRRRPVFGYTSAIVTLIFVVFGGILVWRLGTIGPQMTGAISARDSVLSASGESLRQGNGMPTLVMRQIEITGSSNTQSISAATLREKLLDALSRFDAINIVDLRQPDVGGDYALNGFIVFNEDGNVTVRFRLQDLGDGNFFWSRTFERVGLGRDRAEAEDAIVFELASSMLQPFGIIRSRERTKYLANVSGDPRYRCLLLAADAFRSFDSGEHEHARACLERLTSIDRSFGDGFSYLAIIYNREFLYGFGQDADNPQAIDRAMVLARRGIELNPTSARAYQVLSAVLFSVREIKAAFAALDQAMALNKYDLIIQGEFGGRLVVTGEIDRGLKILAQSAEYGTVRPSWHHFFLFLGYYLRGDSEEATYHSHQITNDDFQLGLVARALVAHSAGHQAAARSAVDRLVALNQRWREDPRSQLGKLIPADAILDRLSKDLAAAGLPGKREVNHR